MSEARASIGLLITGLMLFGAAAIVAGLPWRPVIAVVLVLIGIFAVLAAAIAAGTTRPSSPKEGA